MRAWGVQGMVVLGLDVPAGSSGRHDGLPSRTIQVGRRRQRLARAEGAVSGWRAGALTPMAPPRVFPRTPGDVVGLARGGQWCESAPAHNRRCTAGEPRRCLRQHATPTAWCATLVCPPRDRCRRTCVTVHTRVVGRTDRPRRWSRAATVLPAVHSRASPRPVRHPVAPGQLAASCTRAPRPSPRGSPVRRGRGGARGAQRSLGRGEGGAGRRGRHAWPATNHRPCSRTRCATAPRTRNEPNGAERSRAADPPRTRAELGRVEGIAPGTDLEAPRASGPSPRGWLAWLGPVACRIVRGDARQEGDGVHKPANAPSAASLIASGVGFPCRPSGREAHGWQRACTR